MNTRSKLQTTAATVGAGALVAANSAFAAIDTTAIEASISDALTAVGTVGAAVLGVVGLVLAYRLVRKMIG